jgi:hypothetical protein
VVVEPTLNGRQRGAIGKPEGVLVARLVAAEDDLSLAPPEIVGELRALPAVAGERQTTLVVPGPVGAAWSA